MNEPDLVSISIFCKDSLDFDIFVISCLKYFIPPNIFKSDSFSGLKTLVASLKQS